MKEVSLIGGLLSVSMIDKCGRLKKLAVIFFVSGAVSAQSALSPCDGSDRSRWTNCYGTVTTATGNKYSGEWRDGKHHGQGTVTFVSGNRYIGEFRDGRRNGRGVFTYKNGDVYEGDFLDDKFHGVGVFTFADGEKYAGEFRSDKFHGDGTYHFVDGRFPKKGIWSDGKLLPNNAVVGKDKQGSAPSSDLGQRSVIESAVQPDMTKQPNLYPARSKCIELGYKAGTEKHGECVLRLSK